MNNNTNFFIGIDVSKPHFDASLMAVVSHQKQAIQTARFDNTTQGVKVFGKWLKTHQVTLDEHTLLVMKTRVFITVFYGCIAAR